MKINRLYLENYRIHKNLSIEFSSGINLLLGDNGKGKSSILEAIGYGLFDAKPRNKNQGDTITFGEKNGKIEIEFTGVDGREYLVIRKIPGSTILLDKEKNEILENREEKIRELCGIKGNIKNIYENIIIAKQNEFVNAFKETPANRAKLFNYIFSTEIYQNMADDYCKSVKDRYERELEREEDSIGYLEENQVDCEALKKELEDDKKESESLKTQYEEVSKKLEKIKGEKERYNCLNLEIEQSNSNILNFVDRKKFVEKSVKNLEEKKEKCKLSFLKMQEVEGEYREFLEFENEREISKQKVDTLEIEIKKIQEIEQKKRELEGEEIELKNQISLKNKDIENISGNIEKFFEDLKIQEKELENNKIEIEKSKKLLEDIIPKVEYIEKIEEKLNDWSNRIEIRDKIIKEKSQELEKLEKKMIFFEIEKIEKEIIELEEMDKKRVALEGKNYTLKTQIEENKKNIEELKSSVCPYLKENCENLKGVDISKFFTDKNSLLKEEIEKNEKVIREYQERLNKIEELKNQKRDFYALKEEIWEKKSQLDREKIDFEKGTNMYNQKKYEYSLFKTENKIVAKDELIVKKSELETIIKTLKSDKLEEKVENFKKNIENSKKNIEFLKSEILKIEANLLEKNEKMKELENYLIENRGILLEYEEEKEKLAILEERLKLLKEKYEIYLENRKNYESLESIEEEEKSLIAELEKIEKELLNLEEKLKTLKEEFLNYDGELLKKEEEENRELLNQNRLLYGTISSQIITKENLIKKSDEEQEIILSKRKNIEKIIKKLQLTDLFRVNLKKMGKEISKYMLKKIEVLATDNFRKITGRTEKIVWTNEEEDSYNIYLVKNEKKLSFEQLSGGEQIAISISIRGAMNDFFTDCKFSIFDEPTNNLDFEKRKNLANSIGEILKNQTQSIIVTHDDTFMEMAQKVIRL